jgi:aspartate aminotransferase
MIGLFKKRRDVMFEELRKIRGVDVWKSRGAFYMYPNVKKLLVELGMDVEMLTEVLLSEKHVALLPGTVFSEGDMGRDFIRLSFALDEKLIVEGVNRVKSFVEERLVEK